MVTTPLNEGVTSCRRPLLSTIAPAAGSSGFGISGRPYCAPVAVSFYSGRRSVSASYPARLPQSEFRSLLLWEIENALTELLIYAAVMCEAFHRASSYHRLLITKLAAYRA